VRRRLTRTDRYLYFHSNRNLDVAYSDLDATWVHFSTTALVPVPSPLAPRSDDEQADAGGDPQLEAGIAEVMRLFEANPVRLPERPPFERR
jgi:hypothetical protein